jgi:ribosomal protein S12 methylthiotransferase accessory factor
LPGQRESRVIDRTAQRESLVVMEWGTPMSVRLLDIDLRTPEGRALMAVLQQEHGAPIAAAAARLENLFLLRSPWAPGARFAGGLTSSRGGDDGDSLAQRFSSSGAGSTIPAALASCIGEAVERLAQIERDGDPRIEAPLRELGDQVPVSVRERIASMQSTVCDRDAAVSWISGRNGLTGEDVLLPTDWCSRRPRPGPLLIPDSALSTGVAAGRTWDDAASHAILELVERDAAALWWIGGRRGRTLPLERSAARIGAQLIADLRQGNRERQSWLLDITTDLDIPVYAALSMDYNGRKLVCGLAARLDGESAVKAAILELCQMEVGLLIAEAKLSEEPGSLNVPERALVARGRDLDVGDCSLLHPAASGRSEHLAIAASRHRSLLEHLARRGIDVYLVDLTQPDLAIPVAAAIAPKLQLMPGAIATERLRDAIAQTGGSTPQMRGHALF